MRLIEFRKVILSQVEPVRSIIKLVEAVNECSHVFQRVAETTPDVGRSQFAGEIRRTLDQYIFELLTEIRRLGDDCFAFECSFAAPSSKPTQLQCERAVRRVLDCFEAVLKTPLTAHARAMLKRQYQDIAATFRQINRRRAG